MIVEVKMFALECDNCKVGYIDNHTGFSATNDEQGILEMAENYGWYKDNGIHYCPNCWSTDDDDKLILKKIDGRK